MNTQYHVSFKEISSDIVHSTQVVKAKDISEALSFAKLMIPPTSTIIGIFEYDSFHKYLKEENNEENPLFSIN